MASSSIKRTITTYNRIAPIYLERWRDRNAVEPRTLRFIELLNLHGMSTYPVVDIGCGPGLDAANLREHGLQVFGLDYSIGMIQAGRGENPGHIVQADMRFLPFSTIAGGLWVSASLLHLPRKEVPNAIIGFASALIKGGILYLSVKQGHGDEWTRESYGQPEPRHFTFWQPDELDTMLEEAGFDIIDGWIHPSSVNPDLMWITRFATL